MRGVDSPAHRLAEAVRERRLALGGLTQAEAARRSGVSDTTWNQIEAGKAVSERSLAKIGQALWNDATVPTAILGGAEPPAVNGVATPPAGDLEQAVRELTAMVRELRAELRERRP